MVCPFAPSLLAADPALSAKSAAHEDLDEGNRQGGEVDAASRSFFATHPRLRVRPRARIFRLSLAVPPVVLSYFVLQLAHSLRCSHLHFASPERI